MASDREYILKRIDRLSKRILLTQDSRMRSNNKASLKRWEKRLKNYDFIFLSRPQVKQALSDAITLVNQGNTELYKLKQWGSFEVACSNTLLHVEEYLAAQYAETETNDAA